MAVGRRRTKHKNLPPRLHLKRGRYYYGRNQVFLADNLADALRGWAEREAAAAGSRPATFGDLMGAYLAKVGPTKAPRTRRDNEAEAAKLLIVFGAAPLSEIRPTHVAGYLENRPARVRGNREVSLLSAAWNWGRATGRTDLPNPCAGVKKNKEIARDRLVTPEELAKEITVASQPLRDALELYDMLGARVGELLRMNLPSSEAKELTWKQQKTQRMMRVEIEGELAAKLAEIRGREFPAGVVVSMALLRNEGGQRMTYSALDQRHTRARKAAGVDFQLRDLRGKAATETADSEGMRAAQRLLGHSTLGMTESYVKARSGEVLRTRRRIADKGSS